MPSLARATSILTLPVAPLHLGANGAGGRMSYLYHRITLFLVTTMAMVVPVVFSAWLANHHGQMRVQESAVERSAQQLQRATKVSSQVASAIHQMGQEFSHAPCSSEGLRKMRQLVLRMNLLLDVGYVRDNTLTCSAFGLEPVDIGPASYLSATGYFIRLNAAQPGLSGAAINMTTDAQTGFTTLVHPETILDIVSQKDGESHGLVGLSSGRVIASGGRLDARWIKQIQAEKTGVRLMDGTIIAWKHSDQYDYAAFASVSADVVADSVGQTLLVLVPVGVLAGVFITMGVLAFVRNQTSMPALIKVSTSTDLDGPTPGIDQVA